MEPERLLERIVLKRKISCWRLACLFLVGILMGCLFLKDLDPQALYQGGYIARVRVQGLMLDDLNSIQKLRALANNNAVKGVIINVDSGGGSAVAGEEYYSAIRYISEQKPTVAVLEQMAASAAYMTAIACDHIISHKFTLTGSIGAIMQSYEVTELAEKIGVKFINIKSSPMKAAPNSFEKYTPEVERVQQELIKNAAAVFYDMVKERRNFNDAEILAVNDGRLYTGVQALQLKLVDEIGDERSAIAWMSEKSGLSKDMPIRDYVLAKKPNRWDRVIDVMHGLVNAIISMQTNHILS